jgi:hypothetical protein
MSQKKMVASKMGAKTHDRIQDWAEEEGVSKSQAAEHFARKGLNQDESDSTKLDITLGLLLVAVLILQSISVPDSVGLTISVVLTVIYGFTVIKLTTDIL